MNTQLHKALSVGIDYNEYIDLMETLAQKEGTTGPKQSPALIGYTKLNAARMRRLNKTFKPTGADLSVIRSIDRPLTWLIITESWCGDAAQILPPINKLAAGNANITVVHILRDEHPEVMNLFLTNGARSIPIIAFIDEENEEVLGHWGPRPTELQAIVMARKQQENPEPYDIFQQGMQKWYNQDKGRSTVGEFLATLAAQL
ncbi:MAG: thioredoxin family protein [Bacteroidota bacterium]